MTVLRRRQADNRICRQTRRPGAGGIIIKAQPLQRTPRANNTARAAHRFFFVTFITHIAHNFAITALLPFTSTHKPPRIAVTIAVAIAARHSPLQHRCRHGLSLPHGGTAPGQQQPCRGIFTTQLAAVIPCQQPCPLHHHPRRAVGAPFRDACRVVHPRHTSVGRSGIGTSIISHGLWSISHVHRLCFRTPLWAHAPAV